MAFCPQCGRDSFAQRRYTNYQTPQKIKIYWACTNCGFTEEGYWTTAAELVEAERRQQEGLEDTESDAGD